MLKAKSSVNFLSPKILRGLKIRMKRKVTIFTAKDTSSFEPFCVKIRRGSDPQSREGKSQKVTRGSHRNDVSPLIHDLKYC